MEVAGQSMVEETALIVDSIIVSDATMRHSLGGVEFITNEKSANTSLFQYGQSAEEKHGHGPQADGVLVGSNPREILTHKGQMPEHPVEQPVGIGPNPRSISYISGEMSVGIQSGEPMPA